MTYNVLIGTFTLLANEHRRMTSGFAGSNGKSPQNVRSRLANL